MDNTYTSCLICNGTELVPLPRFRTVHLVRCASCQLVFAGRRPSDEELAQHYRSYGTAWQDSEITRSRYRTLLDSFEPHRESNRIFDMGCGAGYFLEEAANRGWEAYGSEFGKLPLETSRQRGFTVVPAPLSADAFPKGHFDVVTSFEVVEHLRDPQVEAHALSNLLRTGGIFYCTTPNFGAISRHVLGIRWEAMTYPEHLIYFAPSTLSRWLEPFGFRPAELATTGLRPSSLLGWLPRRQCSVNGGRAGGAAPASAGLDQRVRAAAEHAPLLRAAKSTVNLGLTAFRAGDTIKGRFALEGRANGERRSREGVSE